MEKEEGRLCGKDGCVWKGRRLCVCFCSFCLLSLHPPRDLHTSSQNQMSCLNDHTTRTDSSAPLPLLFLAADALTFLGRPKEAAAAFCRLERRLLEWAKDRGQQGPREQDEKGEEGRGEEWSRGLDEGQATVRRSAHVLVTMPISPGSHYSCTNLTLLSPLTC